MSAKDAVRAREVAKRPKPPEPEPKKPKRVVVEPVVVEPVHEIVNEIDVLGEGDQ